MKICINTTKALKQRQNRRVYLDSLREKVEVELIRLKGAKNVTWLEAERVANWDVKLWHKPNRILTLIKIKSKV